MCSQWMPSSKNASPPAIVFVVAPVVRRLQPACDGREVREHHLADRAVGQQPPQRTRRAACNDRSRRRAPRVRRAFARVAARLRSPTASETPASRRARACRPRAPAVSDRGETAAAPRRRPRRRAGRRWRPRSRRSCSCRRTCGSTLGRLGAVAAGVAGDDLAAAAHRSGRCAHA